MSCTSTTSFIYRGTESIHIYKMIPPVRIQSLHKNCSLKSTKIVKISVSNNNKLHKGNYESTVTYICIHTKMIIRERNNKFINIFPEKNRQLVFLLIW